MTLDRTAAFVIGLVTFAAAMIVVSGTVQIIAENHPDSRWATAADELVHP